MPRIVPLDTPIAMRAAITLLGSELRAHLVRYFLEHPGPQKDAADALGVSRKAVSQNVAILVEAGVLRSEPSDDKRSDVYSVDVARLRALLAAPAVFFFGE